ncbi:MAG: PQQ-dependent sugar dehydrogenase [Gemmatimonadales bacterium]
MRLPHLLAGAGLSLASSLSASACSGDSPVGPPVGVGARLQQVVAGLSTPLYLTAPAADPRLFIVEKTGGVRIVKNGILLEAPFLDVTAKVSAGGEQGLLGLAFDPDYATNGRFVVHYTDLAGNTVLSRFQVSADPDRADPASELPILTAAQPAANHNGGQVAFGPDGLLYLGLGDGGGSGDPEGRGQSLTDLLGSILRIDVRTGDPYTVPADNPFVGDPDARAEVWSYGLRNPWRFSFDRGTGDLYIADVGETQREEIDVSTPADGAGRGANYGWSIMEGSQCFRATRCDQPGLTLPVFEYTHQEGCSVTGGYVYRGSAIPSLQGHYFYADFCQGWVRSFRYAGGAVIDETQWPTLAPGGPVLSFGEDSAGELYVLQAGGGVFKIVPEP